MSVMASAPSEYTYRKRTTLTWRQRLARFLRGERRSKAAARKSITQPPPRLGPIGDDVLKFDTKPAVSPSVGAGSLVSDFAALKFDERGTLTSGFDIDFDSTGFKKKLELESNGRTNGVTKKNGIKSSKKNGLNSRRTSAQLNVPVPALEVKGLEEGGFLDTWMKETEKKQQEKERVKRQQEEKEESKRASIISAYSMASVSKKPALQNEKVAPENTSMSLSREHSIKRSPQVGNAVSMFENVPYNRRSITSEPIAIPGSVYPPKRKAEEQVTGTSPPKMRPTERKNDSMLPPTQPASVHAYDRTPPLGSSTFRQSFDLPATDSGRSTSVASKRLSTSSMTSFTSGQAQRFEYTRPGATAKMVDSDAISIASTATSSGRRFEVKEAGLLKPVTSTSADKQARQVSQTISRINSGSMNVPLGPTSAPRPIDLATPRRVVTETVKSINKPDDLSPSRRLSQPAMRNNYVEPAVSLARTPTPEPGTDGTPTPRSRRPSSRLSDRMSWLRELEESNSKNTGRDFVFRKLEGGVASKLAAFENKASGEKPSATATPAIGLSRSNSISKSEAYGIERIPSHLTRSGTMESDKRRSIADQVDGSFKKKLEDMTGSMAEKLQKKASQTGLASSATRGPASLAAKRRLIPQDVLDIIELSGVDQEVAINEYLQQHGIGAANAGLGKTKTWDHDEIMKQLDAEKENIKPAPVAEKNKPVSAPQEEATPVVEKTLEEPKHTVSEIPVAVPTPAPVEEKTPVIEAKTPENATMEVKEEKQFNAASLPLFG